LTENNTNDSSESQKLGFTSWLSSKLLGKKEALRPVDSQFLRDLHDVEKVGRYEIIEKIGQGNMGIVYRVLIGRYEGFSMARSEARKLNYKVGHKVIILEDGEPIEVLGT